MTTTEGTAGPRYLAILLTGVVSLAVGVGSGLLLKFLTEARPALRYTIASSEQFTGRESRIGIIALQVTNPGKREVEDVTCRIRVPGARVTEHRVSGIAPSAWTAETSGGGINLHAAYLNPGESFTLSLLLSLDTDLGDPSVELRGRGVRGQAADGPDPSKRRPVEFFATAASALGAVLSMFAFFLLRYRSSFILGGRHSGDQRDVMAYVLGRFGLHEPAERIRYLTRSLTYWSASDGLTDQWLAKGAANEIKAGAEALTYLLEYASMAASSQGIVHVNIARLALRAGDQAIAREALSAALKKDEPLIRKRIQGDATLSRLHKTMAGRGG